MRILRTMGAILLVIFSLVSFSLALVNLDQAGGRGGLVFLGVVFLVLAVGVMRRK
jgi:hypothetical protein